QRRHDPGGGDLADDVVAVVGNVDVASAVDRHAGGAAHGASQRRHAPGGGDLADGSVEFVGNVNVAGVVDCHVEWVIETCRRAQAVRASRHACGAGQRRRDPSCGDLADGVVAGVGDVDVAGAVDYHSAGAAEVHRGTCAVLTPRYARGAGQRRHDSGGRDLADGVAEKVGDVDVAGAVNRHATGAVEARRGARAVRATRHARDAGQRCHDPGGGDLADGGVECIRNVNVASDVDR